MCRHVIQFWHLTDSQKMLTSLTPYVYREDDLNSCEDTYAIFPTLSSGSQPRTAIPPQLEDISNVWGIFIATSGRDCMTSIYRVKSGMLVLINIKTMHTTAPRDRIIQFKMSVVLCSNGTCHLKYLSVFLTLCVAKLKAWPNKCVTS